MNIFFIADTHFGHINVIKHDNRPFYNIGMHDAHIITNWNKTVNPEDHVYHLGDFFWDKRTARSILPMLKGKIKIVEGNHDKNWLTATIKKEHPNLEVLKPIHELKLKINDIPECFVLCHYPMESWNYMRYFSKHLFGHVHTDGLDHPLRMCVSANVIEYTPISLEKVLEINGWNRNNMTVPVMI